MSIFVIDVATPKEQPDQPQSSNCNGAGSPNSAEFPAYRRLPREKQGYTTPPAHSVGPRRLHGIRTRDIVRIRQQSGQTHTGRWEVSANQPPTQPAGRTRRNTKQNA